MANIVGTVISVEKFLSREEANLEITIEEKTHSLLKLPEDRKYIIPDFQREIRWKEENLLELINDIKDRSKFLGNVILSQNRHGDLEIIDGQQRITIMLMIIQYISLKYGNPLSIMDTCGLRNESFEKFGDLREANFDLDAIADQEKRKEIIASDYFNQRENFILLWDKIKEMEVFSKKTSAGSFYVNLKQSQLNVIANTDNSIDISIQYFLDVNLKGIKLDAEDIFKGYLFSKDPRAGIRDSWKNFKRLTFQLKDYKLIDALKHFFYCDLYKDERFTKLTFNDQFNLSSRVEIDKDEHHKGEHIISVINDKTYMKYFIDKLNQCLEVIIDILETQTPSAKFIRIFDGKTVDHTVITTIHSFLKKIIRDVFEVPKVLALKYISDVLLNEEASNDDYKKIYGIYLRTLFFVVFDSKKSGDELFSVVKSEHWYGELIIQIKTYINSEIIEISKINALNQYGHKYSEEDESIRCKSLAIIYNFLEIKDDKVRVRKGMGEKIVDFLSDNKAFSTEHFIINDSKKCKVKYGNPIIEFTYSYHNNSRNYFKSLFNFIFIDRETNKELNNLHISEKLEFLKDKEFKCDYSKMVMESAYGIFDFYPNDFSRMDQEEIEEKLNNYYSEQFVGDYINLAKLIINNVIERFRNQLNGY